MISEGKLKQFCCTLTTFAINVQRTKLNYSRVGNKLRHAILISLRIESNFYMNLKVEIVNMLNFSQQEFFHVFSTVDFFVPGVCYCCEGINHSSEIVKITSRDRCSRLRDDFQMS